MTLKIIGSDGKYSVVCAHMVDVVGSIMPAVLPFFLHTHHVCWVCDDEMKCFKKRGSAPKWE